MRRSWIGKQSLSCVTITCNTISIVQKCVDVSAEVTKSRFVKEVGSVPCRQLRVFYKILMKLGMNVMSLGVILPS